MIPVIEGSENNVYQSHKNPQRRLINRFPVFEEKYLKCVLI